MAFVIPALTGIAAIVTALLYSSISSTNRYVPNACDNVATFLPARVVGQDMAIRHLVNAVCEHVREGPEGAAGWGASSRHQQGQQQGDAAVAAAALGGGGGGQPLTLMRRKPLVISVHGPPGTGKTYTHTLLARALYNRDPATAMSCPGQGCVGAKVLYGLSYVSEEQAGQLAQVREAILDHLRSTPHPMLVIEEYDKLDCASRGMLRQLIRHPELISTDMSRAIILLESNLGFLELESLLTAVKGNKSQIPPETAERVLRHAALSSWRSSDCERIDDSVAFAATIDHYLPFFPLTREDITVLVEQEMATNYAARLAARGGSLAWEAEVVRWLVGKVDFDSGSYPLEGATQVAAVCVRFLAHLFRAVEMELHSTAAAAAAAAAAGPHGGLNAADGQHKAPLPLEAVEFRLVVAPGGKELRLLRRSQAPARAAPASSSSEPPSGSM